MRVRPWMFLLVFLCLAVVLVAAPAIAQQGAAPVVVTPNFVRAIMPPGLPPCVKSVVLEGNSKTRPSVVLSPDPAGCRFPWRWHTADDRIMMLRGVVTVEMQGGKPQTARSGEFVFIPAHHIHEFACPTACELFLSRTAAADIHYVGPGGNEIPLEEAMAAAKKPAAKKPAAKKAAAKPK